MNDNVLLSIIITSYTTRKLKDIYGLFDLIKSQTYSNLEVVFIAECSQKLYDMVRVYAEEKSMPNFRAIFNENRLGLSAARNMGVRAARGDIIAFIDDDALPFSNWSEEIVKAFKHNSAIGVTGSAYPLWEDESMKWFPEEFYWMISCTTGNGLTEIIPVRNAWGTNMAFRKEVFAQTEPFNNNFSGRGTERIGLFRGLTGEETDFSIRVKKKTGKQILYNPNIKVWHKIPQERINLKILRQRAYREGYAKALLKRLYDSEDAKVLNTEYRLLKRIIFQLLPRIGKQFFRNPTVSLRRLQVTITALFFVGLGYLRGTFHLRRLLWNYPNQNGNF